MLDTPTDRIVRFLHEVGIPVREGEVPTDSFLPGLTIEAGGIVFDRLALTWPGDLLHEAGHIAVTAPAARALLPESLDDHPLDAHGGEIEATAWAYAACVALGLHASVLFHEGGYHGKSAGLVMTYTNGVYPGCWGLSKAGMTLLPNDPLAVERGAYPLMTRWLRE